MKVSQDVPKYMMVSGERAELRGLNLEGLRRRGFTLTEVSKELLMFSWVYNLWYYKSGIKTCYKHTFLIMWSRMLKVAYHDADAVNPMSDLDKESENSLPKDFHACKC